MKTDIHNHVLPTTAVELVRRQSVYGVSVSGTTWSGGEHTAFELTPTFTDPAAKMEELAVRDLDAAVLSAAPPLFFYHLPADAGETMARVTNEGMAEFCAAFPDRLRWMATVPLQAAEAAAEVLTDARALGCVGVEVGTSVPGRRLDLAEFEPFWATAAELGLPVMIHPAYNEPNPSLADYYFANVLGNQLETTVTAERLLCAGVLDRHPELQLILVHSGGYFPYQAGRLRHARTVRPELAQSPEDPWDYLHRLWFDTITHDREALTYLIARVGARRMVVGSDLPFDMAEPEPMRALLAATDQATATEIAERNPEILYPAD